ncbi:anti-sigma factor domain-containing protein [Paenibacillus sp. NEAU-GSW1]|uniref:anti-sigma factor domain-containing protein n=1 Tax=Paenibacillus sp. NEAU-GSW1 TaxID=2682486 RepID=UPI0012E12FB4|nr:anti-sigma factor domain-containing protein [Paenibacillus sp. NEAU-GSW1]MUT67504.1 anti-sigma factor domain-containing protein [Paenibacillus sp. NEAU-GSW1]
MNRGVVMQVKNNKAVVMTSDGGFVSVPLNRKAQVGEEIVFDSLHLQAVRRKPRRTHWYAGAAAAIVLMLLPLLFLVQSANHPVVAYVSMDINPSIEIGVDENKNVWELRALNDDGSDIIEDIDFKGKPIDKVADQIVKKIANADYLAGADKDIVITSLLLNEKAGVEFEKALSSQLDAAIMNVIDQLALEVEANIMALSIPVELRDEAAMNGVSSGKMAVYLMAKEEGYEIPLELLKNESIDKVSEPYGGVEQIVDHSDNASKEKLKELVDKEKKEKKEKADKAKDQSAKSTPNPTEGNSGTATSKPQQTSKPSAAADKPKSGQTDKPRTTKQPDLKNDKRGNSGKNSGGSSSNKGSSGKKDDDDRSGWNWGKKDDNSKSNDKNRNQDNDDGDDDNRKNDDNRDRGNADGDYGDYGDDRDNDRNDSDSNKNDKQEDSNEDRDNTNKHNDDDDRKDDGDRRGGQRN